jgi:hypothetical protein
LGEAGLAGFQFADELVEQGEGVAGGDGVAGEDVAAEGEFHAFGVDAPHLHDAVADRRGDGDPAYAVRITDALADGPPVTRAHDGVHLVDA